MKIVSTTPVRNEEPFIGLTLRAALRWVDIAVVLIHACTDRSPEIVREVAAENPGRVQIIEEPKALWTEMVHRQRMLTVARNFSPTHIAVIDADEILRGDCLDVIRDCVEKSRPKEFWGIKMHNLHRGIHRYRSDHGIWGRQAGTMLVAGDHPALHWPVRNGDDYHHRAPARSHRAGYFSPPIALMHLQFANWRRLTAKHALYKMIERTRFPAKSVVEIDKLYSMALDERGCQTTAVPDGWWAPYADIMEHLDIDAEPWQEAECRHRWQEHGAATFDGLDLFGVVQ